MRGPAAELIISAALTQSASDPIYHRQVPLDLIIPDLLLPADAPETLRNVRLPALERGLARADRARRPEPALAALLASAFALPSPPPLAAIALAAEGGPRDGQWIRADPVHLRVEQDAVALHDPAVLEVSREEADLLLAELQALFAPDGLELRAPSPERWYARVPEGELPLTVPLEEVIGRNVFGMLPRGRGRINWGSALTEAQMLLSLHEVNARREAEGRPAINSVWFWGEGAAPDRMATPYAAVYADEVFARGLALLSGAQVAPKPGGIGEVAAARASASVLAVLDDLTAPLRRGDHAQWQRAAERLDHHWFGELAGAIERFGTLRILLPAGGDTLVAAIGAASRWRWYRARRPLRTHA
jgi:hypothetical protein